MSEQSLKEAIKNYKELQRSAEDLESEIEAVKDTIKAELTRQGVEELTAGEYKVRWTAVRSHSQPPQGRPVQLLYQPTAEKTRVYPLNRAPRKESGGVVKLVTGQLWYCCPVCGQKLHKLAPDAVCNGVTTFCRRCKWEGVMNIKERKGASETILHKNRA